MATHRRLARESQRCLGAFKDPFHRRLLGGNARDEWISALLRVGGLDRRHSALTQCVCVFLCGCLCVSATRSKMIRVWNQMMVQHFDQPRMLLLSTVIVVSVDLLTVWSNTMSHKHSPFYMWCSVAFQQRLPHLMCFESTSVAGK